MPLALRQARASEKLDMDSLPLKDREPLGGGTTQCHGEMCHKNEGQVIYLMEESQVQAECGPGFAEKL